MLHAALLCTVCALPVQSSIDDAAADGVGRFDGAVEEVYKRVGGHELKLWCFSPEGASTERSLPAAVFFFGGGWKQGDPAQFEPHARYLATRGMIAVLADYRVEKRHGTTPFESVEDAKSAVRYLRSHADRLGLDPQRIAAGGGSAGGHLAAAAATLPGLDAADEDPSISSRPDALLLFNPVFDNGPGGFGHERVRERWQEISPSTTFAPECRPRSSSSATQMNSFRSRPRRRTPRECRQSGVAAIYTSTPVRSTDSSIRVGATMCITG